MDSGRFDELTRALATGRTRRRVLAMLGGLTAGIGATVLSRRATVAGECLDAGEDCASGTECCSGVCDAGVCAAEAVVCLPIGATCGAAVDAACCDGLVCDQSETCVEFVCRDEGDECSDLPDAAAACCDGLACVAGVCEAPACAAEGDACTEDANCCAGICCAGFCRDIACCIDDEDPNARCPEGTSCFEGICEEVACAEEGGDCADDQDCCGHLVCAAGTCAHPVDDDGGEPVTGLPNTGTGAAGDRDHLLAGAALAAGAAALLAGTRRRAKSGEQGA